MFFTFGSGGQQLGLGGTFTMYVHVEEKCPCGAIPTARTSDGRMFCEPCLAKARNELAISQAEGWLTAAFTACAPPRRHALYRALTMALHPDHGCDERLMKALNAVRERFPDPQ